MSENTKGRNYFTEMAEKDVSNYVEKKGQFSYLSWAWAVDQLRRKHPDATWEIKKFTNQDGIELPYMLGPNGAFVEVAVTVGGVTLPQIQPVMDFKNKSIANPDAMDVNKAIQRCLVKGIALHGLGLYIYAGEDLPVIQEQDASHGQIEGIKDKAKEFADMRGVPVSNVYEALKVKENGLTALTEAQADRMLDALAGWILKAQEQANATPATEAAETEA